MKKLALVFVLALTMTGCNDPYGNAAKLAQDVAVTINQAKNTVDQFRQEGTVSIAEERTIVGYLDTLNTIDYTYILCVKAAHASKTAVGGFTACANTLEESMSNPTMLVALHVSNPKAQEKLTNVMRDIVTIIETTLTELGGK